MSETMRVGVRGFTTTVAVLALASAVIPGVVEANSRFSSPSRLASRLASGGRATAHVIPSLRELLANFAVLRRRQTAADRSWRPPPSGRYARSLPRLTRLARTLPDGTRVFLTVQRYTGPGWPSVYPVGSYELDINIVSVNRQVFTTNFGPNVNYNVFPLSSSLPYGGVRHGSAGGSAPIWASVIPNGVHHVRWTLACHGARCTERQTRVTVRVHDNVAAADVSGTKPARGPSSKPARVWQPVRVTWYGQGGRVAARFGLSRNLSAPPFMKSSRPR